jgi:hypothetical protein
MLKRFVLIAIPVCITCAAAFITVVGPWPIYANYDMEASAGFLAAKRAIDQSPSSTDPPERLQAGWATVSLTPPKPTPLAGYGDRKGVISTGSHDPIEAKALALSDGADTVVVVGSDLLIVPTAVADQVRSDVAARTALTDQDILFNATHTHSGPGAWGADLVSEIFAGSYDPEIEAFIKQQITEAIVEAVNRLAPATLAHASETVRENVYNRARDGDVDDQLDALLVERQDGQRCYVVRYSAHATILGRKNLAASADYPGYIMRHVEAITGAETLFLAGAMGGMGPKPPSADDAFVRAENMGTLLAERIVTMLETAVPQERLDIASIGIPLAPPPLQLRLDGIGLTGWRASPLLWNVLGLDTTAWLHALRLGDLFLLGAPGDLNGEIGIAWRNRLADMGYQAWPLSFNGAYLGYISPDRYYGDADPDGPEGYEMFTMNWCGPKQEAYFTALMEHMVKTMTSNSSGRTASR